MGLVGHESFYTVFKRKKNRVDVKRRGGEGTALNVNLT